MAAITDHESIRQPADSHGMLWKYMDLPRLVALLAKSELHLAQLASLEDAWEGRYTPAARQEIIDQWTRQSPNRGSAQFQPGYPADNTSELMRSTLYVSCWCLQDCESEAMWRIYGGTSGVAVRTQYDHLARALPSSVFLGQVQYIDPDEPDLPTGNALCLAMHKRHFFRHEAECRVVRWTEMVMPDQMATSRAPFAKAPIGLGLPIDLPAVLKDIVTSPLAPDWFHESVCALAGRFAPWLPVRRSVMCLVPR